jgi:hypothetical protein
MLSKYNEAMQSINYVLDEACLIKESDTFNDSNIIENNCCNNLTPQINEFKGLLFLPNGNPIVILDDTLNQEIINNSVIINYNEQRNLRSTYYKKNTQEQLKEGQIKIPKIFKNQQKSHSNSYINTNSNNDMLQNIFNKSANIEEMANITSYVNEENLNSSGLSNANVDSLNCNIKSIVEKETKLKILEEGKGSFNLMAFLNKFNLVNVDFFHSKNELSNDKPLGFDLLKYFNKPETSDIVLNIQNESIYCNKVYNLI